VRMLLMQSAMHSCASLPNCVRGQPLESMEQTGNMADSGATIIWQRLRICMLGVPRIHRCNAHTLKEGVLTAATGRCC